MPSKTTRFREIHRVLPTLVCLGRVHLGRNHEAGSFRDPRRGQMLEVEAEVDFVDVVEEQETEIVELSLVDLQFIGGGAGNAAIDF